MRIVDVFVELREKVDLDVVVVHVVDVLVNLRGADFGVPTKFSTV